ncbi:hypothetical protein E2P81_ATG12139 [Venturia nashicola]|nr:hypothetical protein E2P81_ATG12139 [Venturia nashicola]
MEGLPDAKRPRLDHEHTSFPPASISRSATTPAPAPQSRPYPDYPHLVPPNHPYHPPASGPPSLSAQPAVPGPHRPSFSLDPGPDPRGPPVYGPPTSQAGYHEQSNEYAVNPHASRSGSFSTDPSPTAPNQHPPIEQRGHPLPPLGPERMDLHAQPLHVYQQQLEQHPNHQVPNGLPYSQHEPYVTHGYQQSPVSAHAPAHPFGHPGQGPTNFQAGNGPRRKQVRAQQACNNCRQRKQKCDEQKPCAYCKAEGTECEYKEVPPPKTDRAMSELKETIGHLQRQTDRMEQNMDRRLEEMARIIMGNNQNQSQNMIIKGSPSSDNNEDRKIAIGELSDSSTLLSRTTMGRGDYAMEVHGHGQYQNDHRQRPGEEPFTAIPMNLTRVEGRAVNVLPSTQQSPTDPPDQPHSHETGAQHLMTWPIISEWFLSAGINQREYIWKAELGQGTLRPYGSSWAPEPENDDEYHTPMSPPQSAEVEQVSMWSEPKEGSWGTEFSRSDKSYTSVGGLNPDGSLCLDAHVIKDLWVSYGRNMWVMHPFMDARELRLFIEKFIRKHSPSGHRSRQSPSTRYVVPNSPLPTKRKYHDDDGQSWSPPTMTPERSMENAIVLLVLALGRVVQEEGFLLQDLPLPSISTPQSYTSSPRVYSPRPHGAGSPASGAGRSSTASEKTHSRFKVKRKHTDMYPGSAYFAYASDILGNNKGGTEIIHAQANLLAGLYLMQLGRVVESSSYMNETFRIATILRGLHEIELFDSNNPNDVGGREPMNDQLTIISMLCWSALQLDSDLRAELETLPKPAGALMYNDPTVRKPDRLIGTHDGGAPFETAPGRPAIDPNDVLWHYITQINLRLTLNRVHSALYKIQDSVSSKAPWADADASGLFIGLQNFRELIIEKYPRYRWTDGDPLPTELLQARLRAKFYGAAYIILRPYISNALTYHADEGACFSPADLQAWLKNEYKADEVPTNLPKNNVQAVEFQSSRAMALNYLWCCKKSIDSAMHSTIAFDGVADPVKRQRLRVTNIHGTATAQFSNMLVLTAVYKSWLHPLVDVKQLRKHMDRTIRLHRYLCPLAPIFRINLKVLLNASVALAGDPGPDPRFEQEQLSTRWAQGSPHSMHGSQSSMQSPLSHTPVGNPPYNHHRGINSAHASFGSH